MRLLLNQLLTTTVNLGQSLQERLIYYLMQVLDSSKNYVTNKKHGETNSTCHGWVNNQKLVNFVDLSYVKDP